MTSFGELLNGEIVTLPLPADAPTDIPRITLPSADKKLKLEIALSRVNFYRFEQENAEILDLDGFLNHAKKIFDCYIKTTNSVVGRIASVLVKYLDQADPGKTLATHFCKEERLSAVLNRPESFELHAHKRYSLDRFNVNSWVRSKTGSRRADKTKKIILIEQDLNTLPEEIEKLNFTIDDIAHFYTIAAKEHENIISKYYPDNG